MSSRVCGYQLYSQCRFVLRAWLSPRSEACRRCKDRVAFIELSRDALKFAKKRQQVSTDRLEREPKETNLQPPLFARHFAMTRGPCCFYPDKRTIFPSRATATQFRC